MACMESNTIQLQNIAEESSLRTNPPKLLNVTEASTYIGVSQRTLRSWISGREIKVARLGGRVVLRLVDVDRFIERHLEGGLL